MDKYIAEFDNKLNPSNKGFLWNKDDEKNILMML